MSNSDSTFPFFFNEHVSSKLFPGETIASSQKVSSVRSLYPITIFLSVDHSPVSLRKIIFISLKIKILRFYLIISPAWGAQTPVLPKAFSKTENFEPSISTSPSAMQSASSLKSLFERQRFLSFNKIFHTAC